MAVGGERGVVRIWKQGEWDLGDKRAVVDRGESLDVLCAVPEELGEMAATGMGSGKIRIVDIRKRQALAEMSHDEVEGVVGLGFDTDGRMISGGGLVVKVWQQSELDDDHDIDDEVTEILRGNGDVSEADDCDDVQGESTEEDEAERGGKKKKKRKRKKGKTITGPKNGTTAFKGLDWSDYRINMLFIRLLNRSKARQALYFKTRPHMFEAKSRAPAQQLVTLLNSPHVWY